MNYPKWATPERRARLEELTHLACAKGEHACPVIARFTVALLAKIGPPEGNDWVWLVRAAMATHKLVAEMPELDRYHMPPWVRHELISFWKAEDRAIRSQLWKVEQRRLHAMPQIRKRGPFGTIDREVYHAQRPLYEIVGIGLNAFTQHRIAEVRIPGLRRTIYVDLHGLRVGRNKLHKLARYKRGSIPKELVSQMEARVRAQVAKVL